MHFLKKQRYLAVFWVLIILTIVPISSKAKVPVCRSFFTAPVYREWKDIKELTTMSFNLANIYELQGKFESIPDGGLQPISHFPARPKTEKNIEELKTIFKDVSPDIAILQEVEDLSALQRFARELPQSYQSFLMPGNDVRGIDIGFLVKSDLPIDIEIRSHKDYQFPHPLGQRGVEIFTRDFPVLILRKKKEKSPFLLVFGVHNKSERDRANDPRSTKLRTAQIAASNAIIKKYQTEFGKEIPIIMAGDFNTDVLHSPEMKQLAWIPSAFELTDNSTPYGARITHTHHKDILDEETQQTHERIDMKQMDDIRLTGFPLGAVLSAQVYRYHDENGRVKPFALSYKERLTQTSDHLPVVVKFSTGFIHSGDKAGGSEKNPEE